jgi:hypothetical protein
VVEFAILAAFLVSMFVWIAAVARRRRRRDALRRFAAATQVLKGFAEQPRHAPAEPVAPSTPSVHVLHDVAVLRLDRGRPARGRRSRQAHRPDEQSLARRTMVANLPSISAPRPGSGSKAG